MTKSDWMDLTVLERKKYNCLSEVMDLSRQLSEVLDRNDGVSARMLVAMREEPLGKLQAADQAVREQLEALHDREEAVDLAALLNGGPPPQPGERAQQLLCEQVAANRRRLSQIIELDKVLNQRLGRENTAAQPNGLQG